MPNVVAAVAATVVKLKKKIMNKKNNFSVIVIREKESKNGLINLLEMGLKKSLFL